MESKKFCKYDYGSTEANISWYGKGCLKPPDYDMTEIQGIPLALVCGREDLLSSQKDYLTIVAQLTATDSLVSFKEYDIGHIGMLVPVENTHIDDMVALLKKFQPELKKEGEKDVTKDRVKYKNTMFGSRHMQETLHKALSKVCDEREQKKDFECSFLMV